MNNTDRLYIRPGGAFKRVEDPDKPSKRRRKGRSSSHSVLPPDFESQYNLHEELGRGAFAVVYRCSLKATGEERAAKVIDLRPIRMKGNLNMDRVMREVNILKGIDHPNIVRLVEVIHTLDTMVIIMEYIRGRELFFEILDRNHYSEEEARPIFRQLASCIAYLHSVSILHRDVKPENVLIIEASEDPTVATDISLASSSPTLPPSTTIPVVKLLDFGLSKIIDPLEGGSDAKTFVGTRAYLAPEVELRAHGQGGSYGPPADCWSLGAVLHVMLVARFPCFDVVHKVSAKGTLTPFSGVLKVEGSPLWDRLSPCVKDIIKGLMTPNPGRRLTAAGALDHPWTKGFSEFPSGYTATHQTSMGGKMQTSPVTQAPHHPPAAPTPPSPPLPPSQKPAPDNPPLNSDPISRAPVEIRLGLLVKIQQWIATSLGVAFNLMVSSNGTEVASCVREGALICRHELHLTIKLLRKVFETAGLVLNVFPDLELAICQNELTLAQSFFATIKGWLSEIRSEIKEIRQSNEDATLQMSRVIKRASKELIAANKLISYREKEKLRVPLNTDGDGHHTNGKAPASSPFVVATNTTAPADEFKMGGGQAHAQGGNGVAEAAGGGVKGEHVMMEHSLDILLPSVHCDESYPIEGGEYDKKVDDLARCLNDLLPSEVLPPPQHHHHHHHHGHAQQSPNQQQDLFHDPRQIQDRQMAQVVISLRRLDRILERLETFWARCEVDLGLMIQRGDHLKCLTAYAQTPEMVSRLRDRLSEYKFFWCRVKEACTRYLTGVTDETVAAMYSYLDNADVTLPPPDAVGDQPYTGRRYPGGGGEDSSGGDMSGESAFESNDEG